MAPSTATTSADTFTVDIRGIEHLHPATSATGTWPGLETRCAAPSAQVFPGFFCGLTPPWYPRRVPRVKHPSLHDSRLLYLLSVRIPAHAPIRVTAWCTAPMAGGEMKAVALLRLPLPGPTSGLRTDRGEAVLTGTGRHAGGVTRQCDFASRNSMQASSRARVRSRPRNSSTSKRPGLTAWPVTATRVG